MHKNPIWEVWQPSDIPPDWNRGNRFPICKRGNEEEVKSYRRVSLSSVPGKTMEQILQETMPRSCTGPGQSQAQVQAGAAWMEEKGFRVLLMDRNSTCSGHAQKPPVPWLIPLQGQQGGWSEVSLKVLCHPRHSMALSHRAVTQPWQNIQNLRMNVFLPYLHTYGKENRL